MIRFIAVLASLAALAGAGPVAHAEAARIQPPAATPPATTPQGKARQPLSSRLAETNGTLRPPPVDPGMRKVPGQKGAMPVIPPPGTAGGRPGAVPK